MSSLSIKLGFPIVVIVVGILVSIYAIYTMNMDNDSSVSSRIDLEKLQLVSHELGDSNAPIKIIEFGDYQCPFCGEWFQHISPGLNEKYISTGQVQLFFVDYPFLGPDSYPAAYASFCAEEQDRYWEFHGELFINQGNTNDGWADSENIRLLAIETELDMEKFDQCMESTDHKEKLDTNLQMSLEHGINQTPTFFVLGPGGDFQKIEGKQPLVVFDEIIDNFQ